MCLIFAEHEVLGFGQGQCVPLADVVANTHKSKRTRAPCFARHTFNVGGFFGADACEKGAVEDQMTCGPHAARQVQIGDKTPLCGVPVAAQIGQRCRVPKVDVMRKGGQRVARGDGGQIEGRLQGLHAGHVHRVLESADVICHKVKSRP